MLSITNRKEFENKMTIRSKKKICLLFFFSHVTILLYRVHNIKINKEKVLFATFFSSSFQPIV